MSKSNTLNRIVPLLTIIALVAIVGIAAATALHAQTARLLQYNISINFTDARINTVPSGYIVIPLESSKYVTIPVSSKIYQLYETVIPPYYFTASKFFKIVIANASTIYYITSTNKTEKYLSPVTVSAIAKTNSTGGTLFKIRIPYYYANLIAYWKVVILVNSWGKWWIAANFTTAFPMSLSLLLRTLAKIGTGEAGIPVINSTTYHEILKYLGTNDILANVYINGKPLIYATNAKYNIYVEGTPWIPNVIYKPLPATQVITIKTSSGELQYKYFVYGAEYFAKWKEYALWLPYIQSFIVGVNALNKADCVYFLTQFEAILPSGAKIVLYESEYNSTLTSILEKEIGVKCVFGPIYYIAPLYKGLEVEKIPKSPSGYEPYMPLVVLTQSPFGSLYFVLHVYYKTRFAGTYVDTFEADSIPRGLLNFGVIALPNYTAPAAYSIVGTGLYGYIYSSASGSYVLQPYVYVVVPKTKYELNTKMLKTLINTSLPRELENLLSYRWYEVTTSGKRVYISTGPLPNVTLVGKKYFDIKLEENYTVSYTYSGPIYSVKRYYVEVFYRYNPIITLDITDLVNHTLFTAEVVEFPVKPVRTDVIPVLIHIRRYVPDVNVTEAPSLTISPQLYHRMVVYIYRSTYPRENGTLYLVANVTYSCQIGDSVVMRKTYIAGPVSYTPVIYLVTRLPTEYNITYSGIKNRTKTSIMTGTPVLVGPRINDTYYFYHIYVYYGQPGDGGLQIGTALFAVGSYTILKNMTTPVRIGAWIWPVGGYEILNFYNRSQIIDFADKWAKVNKFYTVGMNKTKLTNVTFLGKNVTCYNLYEAVGFVAMMTYFVTMYNVTLAKALLLDVSATVQVVRLYNGRSVVLAEVPARYTQQILIPIPIRMVNGWPQVGTTSATYTFILNYAGYKLQAIRMVNGKPKPLVLTVTQLLSGLVWKRIMFPIVYEWFKVMAYNNKTLPGFVVQVFSTKTGEELWRAITNGKGIAYIGALPANRTVKVVVRTIVPAKDRIWFMEHLNANKTLTHYNNTYAQYAALTLGYKPQSYVYTLGTRGPLDAGLVANKTLYEVPGVFGNLTKIKIVNIRPVKVYVVYKNGTNYVLLNTLPVYPCALPVKCPAVLYNLAMVINDTIYPRASVKNGVKLADFRILGINNMGAIFAKYAKMYLNESRKALTHYEETGLEEYLNEYIMDMSHYVAAKLLELASSNVTYALFYIPPAFGVGNVWRVIIPGQKLDVQIYYLGYKVFDNYVTIPPYNVTYIVEPNGAEKAVAKNITVHTMTGENVTVKPGSIVIVADVKPVTFRLLTRDNATAKNLFLGIVMTGSLTRTYVALKYAHKYKLADIVTRAVEPFNTTLPEVITNVSLVNASIPESVLGYYVYVPTNLMVLVNGTDYYYEMGLPNIVKNATTLTLNTTIAGPLYYGDLKVVVNEQGQPVVYSLSKVVNLKSIENVTYGNVIKILTAKNSTTTATTLRIGNTTLELSSTKVTSVSIYRNNVEKDMLGAIIIAVNASRAYDVTDFTVTVIVNGSTVIGPVSLLNYVKSVERSPRLAVVMLPVPPSKLSGLEFPSQVKVKIEAEGYGELKVWAYIYSGAPLKTETKDISVLVNSTHYLKTVEINVASPEKVWKYIYGTPIMLIVPVTSGNVTVPLPEWATTTSYRNATIARIYVFNAFPVHGQHLEVETVYVSGVPYPIVLPSAYLLLNLVKLHDGALRVYVGLLGTVSVTNDRAAKVLGPYTGATSTLIYPFAEPSESLASVDTMPSTVTLYTTMVTKLNVTNKNLYDIIVLPKYVIKMREHRIIPVVAVTPTALVNVSAAKDLALQSNSLAFDNISVTVSYKYWPPNYTFYTVTVSGIKSITIHSWDVAKYEVTMHSNLTSALYYAYNHTYLKPSLLAVPVLNTEIPVESVDGGFIKLGKEVIPRKPILALKKVFGWNGKPLANATIVVFKNVSSDLCHPLAVAYVGPNGTVDAVLPYGRRVVVFWYDSYIKYLETACRPLVPLPSEKKPGMTLMYVQFSGIDPKGGVPIIIYDSAKAEDVQKLGNAVANVSSIYTWVYSLVIQVLNKNGMPLKHAIVVVKDAATNGEYFYASAVLNGTGGAVIKDIRTAYAGAVSSVPASNLLIDVFVPVGKYLVPVLLNYPLSLQRGSTSPVFVTTVKVSTAYVTLPITVQLQVPGMKAMPLAGAAVKVVEYVPAVSYVTYGPYIVPEMSTLATVKAGEWTLKTGNNGIVTVGPLNVAATGATVLYIKVVNVDSIPLGYTEKVQLTPGNITPPVITIPGAQVKVMAVSASGSPLSIATVNVTCTYEGKTVYTGYGKGSVSFILPLPENVAKSPIVCTAAAVAPGHVKSKVYTLRVNKPTTYELKVRVPVTGWYIPGIGYVGWPQIALWIVIIFIVIIIIVIGLIEYQHWRRKRLVSVLERPPSGGR